MASCEHSSIRAFVYIALRCNTVSDARWHEPAHREYLGMCIARWLLYVILSSAARQSVTRQPWSAAHTHKMRLNERTCASARIVQLAKVRVVCPARVNEIEFKKKNIYILLALLHKRVRACNPFRYQFWRMQENEGAAYGRRRSINANNWNIHIAELQLIKFN